MLLLDNAWSPRGDDPAVTGPSGTVSYAQLRRSATEYAERCVPGRRVAVVDADPVAVLVAVLGAAAAGATPVVVDPNWPAGQQAAALRNAGATGAPPAEAPATATAPPADAPAALAWIGFTSGSAGTPRPIGRAADSWTRSFRLVSELTGITARQRVLIGGTLASSLFLFGSLHALWAGAHVVVPRKWEPGRLPAADVAHCVPAMLSDLLDAPQPPGTVVCGGAALPERIRAAAVARGVRVAEYYGATELSFVAWRDPAGLLLPFPGVDIRVRDGEIWARSPYLCSGYAADGVSGPLRWDDDGFATVGDLGAIGRHGDLTVLGRADGTILAAGAVVLPEDVEAALSTTPGVRDVVVVGTPHPRFGAVVTAVIEPEEGQSPRLADLRAAARLRLSVPQRPRHWYLMERLPRTGAGKAARHAIAVAVGDRSLAARRLT